MGPPSNNPTKEGGIPPHPPSFIGWVERARDRGQRWVYSEPGKARCIFTAKGHLVVHVWFLFLRHRLTFPWRPL